MRSVCEVKEAHSLHLAMLLFEKILIFSPFLHPGLSCEYQKLQPRAFRTLSYQISAVWGPGY